MESFPPWPHFGPDEIEATATVLRSGKINAWTGEETGRFEKAYAAYLGVPHAIALANGTLALELALHALGIGPGDDVLVTPRSYVASATCVALCGARPVFADVDLDSQNVTVATLRAALTPSTRAVIVVHLAGWPCDMPAIMKFAREHSLKVIEDCAQAHHAGIEVDGHMQLAGSFGDVGCFSFCQDKILSTGGEGGLFVTRDEALWRKAWAYKDHGKSYEAVFERQHPPGFRWVVEGFGSNWRLTEFQSVIGRIQLGKLPEWSDRRNGNAKILQEAIARIPGIRCPVPPAEVRHAYYRAYAFVEPEKLRPGWNRERILKEVGAAGFPCFVGSCPEIYLEKAFIDHGFAPAERLPNAKLLEESSLAFLVHPTIDDDTMRRYSNAAGRVLQDAMTLP
ncbi:MAG: DegT/DnrJ/EryC1/StrS aminotransferase family protein [Deltaproteobacteria bacterium]|nr:DegT/DnrJ/EryC1/StrS aminotransferase family protein [Deltaproteobacteria bacterium]